MKYETNTIKMGKTTTDASGNSTMNSTTYSFSVTPRYRTVFPYQGNWTLINLSSDTIYTFSPTRELRPQFVRTPPIHSMNQRVYLILDFFSDRYYFMSTMKQKDKKFPTTPFLYDRQEKAFFNFVLCDGAYSTKNEINFDAIKPVNSEVSWQRLEAYHLVKSYKKGELKDGKLKEIASKLDEEDNPVIMLVKRKK